MKLTHLFSMAFVLIGSALSAACGATPESADVTNADVAAAPGLTAEQQAQVDADTLTYSDEAAEDASDEASSGGAPAKASHLAAQSGCYYNCYIDYHTLYQDRSGAIRYKSTHGYVRGCTQITRCARG